jgi:hypothetical protein
MRNMDKVLSLMLVVVFLTSLVTLQPATVKAQSKTITVPDDYPTIQAAIGNASVGDTVFVKRGTYYVNTLEIDKPINLVGQDPSQTIINGLRDQDKTYPIPYEKSALRILSSNTVISGFTITNCYNGISFGYHLNLNSVNITGNYLIDNWIAVDLTGTYLKAQNFVISNNIFTNDTYAIIFSGSDSEITNNQISSCLFSIRISGSENLVISYNHIFNNSFGLSLQNTSNVNIFVNNFIGSIGNNSNMHEIGYGVEFVHNSIDTIIHDNNFEGNTHGINLKNYLLIIDNNPVLQGFGNIVYHNNFVNNNSSANIEHQYPYSEAYRQLQAQYKNLNSSINGSDLVSWDNGKVGNYWSDYNGHGSYVIDENNTDHYPLTQQVYISTTEPTLSPIILPIIIIAVVAVGVSLIVYFKKSKH